MQQTITYPELFPPRWAVDFGEERDFGIYAEFEVRDVRFPMRWIPPGEFLMGTAEEEEVSELFPEKPRHRVKISQGFWLGITPVTQEQWCTLDEENPSRFQDARRPVEKVSWQDCCDWIAKLNQEVGSLDARLPSEAEWEYACRAGSTTKYSFGESEKDLEKYAWFSGNAKETHSVASRLPNEWGLFDLCGNVWEWCFDGPRNYSTEAAEDPLGSLDEGAGRVFRGGSWSDSAQYCRSAYRSAGDAGFRDDDLGFRLVAGQALPGPEGQGNRSSGGAG